VGGIAAMPKAEAASSTMLGDDSAPELSADGKFCSLEEIMNGSCESCQ
jgi:hypothetical protein